MAEEKKGKHDAEEVKEILDAVSEKVPKLLNELADVLYGAQQSKKYAIAVAQFYQELKKAGMTDAQAYELTKQYMSVFNIAGALGNVMKGGGGDDEDDELGKEIEKKIKMKIVKKLDEDEEEK